MNEHSFTRAVMRLLPKEVHVQSMTTASLSYGGTPDRYVDYRHDLWIEFKYARSVSRNGVHVGKMLSELQKQWLRRRYKAGMNACVIVGLPSDRARGVVLESPSEWEQDVLPTWIATSIKSAPELAHYILKRVGG